MLDNFFISAPVAHSSGVMLWDISDHYPIFTILKNIFSVHNGSSSIKYRLLNETTLHNFQSALSRHDFHDIINSSDLDFAIGKLESILMETYNECCPILTKKISRKDRDKPWITSHIKYLINERQKKYKEKLQNSLTEAEFNQFRNYVNRQITGSKKDYFDNLFKEVKSNMKKMWEVLNGLVKSGNNRNSTQIKSLCINGNIIDDALEISKSISPQLGVG